MADHVLSILVKAVGASKAAKDLKGVDSTIANIGNRAKAGVATAAGNIARLGVAAGAGLGAMVKIGIDNLAELEDATTKVDGAIKQMGQTGKITSAQVAAWSNKIESDIGAAFDDKAITAATATLIRFGSVTPKNLNKAMVVMTDLAAKTGDVDSAATLLAKALADPTKASGKLARQGIVLTKAQEAQIKALVKAGKMEKAQAVLLDIITVKTKGAAEATQGPYRRALSTLADITEDAQKALAEGFLPVLQRVATFLKGKLADPKTLQDIRGFGRGLADAFDKVLSLAGRVPWDSIAGAMKLSGIAAKGILDAFVAMPPWVQTAIVTGWGLNKLTGGAVSGIIGELGKGLIKGVLGMTAGVVNINAGVVNGAGGTGAAGAAAGGLGLLGAAAIGVTILGVSEAVREMLEARGKVDAGEPIPFKGAQFGPRTAPQAQHVQEMIDKAAGKKLEGLGASAARNVAAAERLEKIFGPKTTEAAKLGVVATERAEAIAAQKADRIHAQIAAGDSRSENAMSRITAAQNATRAAVFGQKLSVIIKQTISNKVILSAKHVQSQLTSQTLVARGTQRIQS